MSTSPYCSEFVSLYKLLQLYIIYLDPMKTNTKPRLVHYERTSKRGQRITRTINLSREAADPLPWNRNKHLATSETLLDPRLPTLLGSPEQKTVDLNSSENSPPLSETDVDISEAMDIDPLGFPIQCEPHVEATVNQERPPIRAHPLWTTGIKRDT